MTQVQRKTSTIEAIHKLLQEIKWKPDKDRQHLQTRISYGHLSASSTMGDYEHIIRHVLHDNRAEVYIYIWHTSLYPTIVGLYEHQYWLVIFSLDGIMETAFPPTDAVEYLANPRFQKLGLMGELLA